MWACVFVPLRVASIEALMAFIEALMEALMAEISGKQISIGECPTHLRDVGGSYRHFAVRIRKCQVS